jgi:hypothetical protein
VSALDFSERFRLLSWLAAELDRRGIATCVVRQGTEDHAAVLRSTSASGIRYVACVPAPQAGTWAWVWPYGWALVDDPWAVPLIAEALR